MHGESGTFSTIQKRRGASCSPTAGTICYEGEDPGPVLSRTSEKPNLDAPTQSGAAWVAIPSSRRTCSAAHYDCPPEYLDAIYGISACARWGVDGA